MRYFKTMLLALTLAVSVQACRSGTPFDEENANDANVHLIVKNDNINEMDVYAVGDGVATRVGTVEGLATKGFTLDPSLYLASDLRIVATPFGGNGRASTGPLTVGRGQTIEFTVRTSLRTSSVNVR